MRQARINSSLPRFSPPRTTQACGAVAKSFVAVKPVRPQTTTMWRSIMFGCCRDPITLVLAVRLADVAAIPDVSLSVICSKYCTTVARCWTASPQRSHNSTAVYHGRGCALFSELLATRGSISRRETWLRRNLFFKFFRPTRPMFLCATYHRPTTKTSTWCCTVVKEFTMRIYFTR